MKKQFPVFEWQVVERDAEWESLCSRPLPGMASGVQQQRCWQSYLSVLSILSLLLTSAAIHWVNARQQQRQIVAVVSTANQGAAPLAQPKIALVDVQADQVVAEVVILDKEGAPTYRQTQIYRLMSGSWQQSAIDAAHWGPEQHLESTYFRFVFRGHDAQAVHTAAARLDILYATMRRTVGLPLLPNRDKRVIEVSMARPSGDVLYNEGAHGAVVVASPARYRAPVVLTDADLLVQAIVLALSAELTTEMSTVYTIDASWVPLLNALQLWQLWNLDLPLAEWRVDLVKWLYVDLPTTTAEGAEMLPARYDALCAAHQLWLQNPGQIQIPLTCDGALDRKRFHLSFFVRYPPKRLTQLAVPAPTIYSSGLSPYTEYHTYIGQTIALATLIDFAVRTYGQARLPILLASLDKPTTWEKLVPTVFGLSATDFEAGWQTDLATK